MSKRGRSPGFNERIGELRRRLGVAEMTDFAVKLGLKYGTYYPWEAKNAAPSMATLKQAIRALGVSGWRDLVLWLADGEGEPPGWFYGQGPVPPDSGDAPRTATPSSAEDLGSARPALKVLTRLAGEVALDAYERREILPPKVDEIVRGLVQIRGVVVLLASLSAGMLCGARAGVVEWQTRGIQKVSFKKYGQCNEQESTSDNQERPIISINLDDIETLCVLAVCRQKAG